ncbi:hypothetical protein LT85_2325 [Collimonas arenae]|uniref:Toxin VasX N-terminal region domain-containing protein n=2 Tax=Collimonas arenae TaxID=279058 RepID=A0A0A1F9R2_9BURK|nr:hypothetical protein LT85_2325 [Collimonas arenae]
MGNAPKLSAPFVVGDKETDLGKSLALPEKLAHYTLRLLRPGYLYVFDEKRSEWSAYMVMDGAYLFEFDIRAKAPPGGWGKVDFACKREGDAMIARCITVKDAPLATKVWLGFSDVTWTEEVLKKHDSADYRKAHMQCLDMAAWRSGASQAHAADFSKLSRYVAEYTVDPAGLQHETVVYVTKYLPKPYTKPEQLNGNKAEDKKALTLLSRLILELWPRSISTVTPELTRMESAAWAFSTQPFYLQSTDAQPMAIWGDKAAAPYRPVMLALDDPTGIAMELSGLAMQFSAEFTEEPQRKWQYETALTINALKDAVGNGALKDDIASNQGASDMMDGMAHAMDADMGMSYVMKLQSASEQARIKKTHDDIADQRTAQGDAIKADGWKKYGKYFDEPAQQKYLNVTYPAELHSFAEKNIAPLDLSYLAWLKSKTFQACLTHNFDSKNLSSGEAYLALVTMVIHNTSGRTAVGDYLAQCLQQDPGKPEAWVMRAFAFNQDKLVQAWIDAAAEKGTSPSSKLSDIIATLHDKFKDVIVDGEKRELKGFLAGPVNRYVYQLFGPAMENLNKAFNSVPAAAAGKMPPSAKRLVTMLGNVALAENPHMIMVDLRGELTRKDAVRTLSAMVAKLGGGDEQAYRSGVRNALAKMGNAEGKVYPYKGVMLLDKTEAGKLTGLSGNARTEAVGSMVLKPDQLENLMESRISKLGNIEVKGGTVQSLLSLVLMCSAFGEMTKEQAKGNYFGGKTFNFAAAVTTLAGGITETTGHALTATSWGGARTATQIKFMAIKMETRASWLTGGGKLLGVVGGVIAGVVTFFEGVEMLNKRPVLGGVTMALGIGSVVAAMLLLGTATAGMGFVLGILIAIILGVVGWLTPNALQDWLNQSGIFGKHEGGEKYVGPIPQMLALEALSKGD